MEAFILAGGRSTRMGRDKALVEFNGVTLIEHTLARLRALGFTPRIAGSRPDLAGFAPVLVDNYPGLGPLSGIEAALAAGREELNLFVAIDQPLVPSEFLHWMIDRATQTGAFATWPRLQGRPHPLCAIYSRSLLPHAQAALPSADSGVTRTVELAATASRSRIDAFDAETIAASLLPSAEWPDIVPVHRWFQNLNTPEELAKASLEETPRIR
jgi:molybdopterin-guanine dinucleotide biosynthesis protein A